MIFILLFTVIAIKISGKEVNKFVFETALIFSAILLASVEIHILRDVYEINNSSLVHHKGIISNKIRKVDLIAISDADSKQNSWQRILNYGDVSARMFSAESTLLIKNINSPVKFANFLEEKINEKNKDPK